MSRHKIYKSISAVSVGIAESDFSAESEKSAVIEMPSGSQRRQPLDLSQWLGKGFDDWIYATAEALRSRLKSGVFSLATIVSLAKVGAHSYFGYLAHGNSGVIPARPQDLTSSHVDKYVAWLKAKHPTPWA